MVRRVDSISPYLIPGKEDFIKKADNPLADDFPRLVSGSMARDDGNLILDNDEKIELATQFPSSSSLLRPLIGTSEVKQGSYRWCLWINDEQLDLARAIPPLWDRVEKVRAFRAASKANTTRGYAKIPHKFAQRAHRDVRSIVVPKNTPEGMTFVTPIYVDERTVTTDLAFVSYTEEIWVLS